jgi:hypothetical protein
MTLPASLSGQGSSLLYAIDIVIPLILTRSAIDLVPRAACARRQHMLWWLNLATLLGWLLSSIFVLSLARVSRTR